MEASTTLLQHLNEVTAKNPEKWTKTPSRSCFLLRRESKAITICQYLDGSGGSNISITVINSNGNKVNELSINQKVQPELFEAYFSFYLQVKKIAIDNDFQAVTNALLATA